MFHLLLLIFNYRSVDGCRGLGERMCCGLGCKHSADTFELTSSVHLLVIWRIWKWWLKHSLLNLYFYSPDPRNVVPFTEVHTRAVLAEKGPFSGLAKCWRTYFLGDVVFQGKKFTVPSSTVYTSCLCFLPHVTQIICNRSLTLLYAKANDFIIEEKLSHEGTV